MKRYDEDDIYNGKQRFSALTTTVDDDFGGSIDDAYKSGREAARYKSNNLAKAKSFYCKGKNQLWIDSFVKGFKFQKRYTK